MQLLHAGVDITVIALWLGHEHSETAQIYIHADQTIKQRALDRTTPPGIRPGRYRPPDKLLAFLEQQRTSCKDQVHAVLAKLGVPVTHSDVFGRGGGLWLDQLVLPAPYAGKVASLRALIGVLDGRSEEHTSELQS